MKSRFFNVCPYCGGDTEYDQEENKKGTKKSKKKFKNYMELQKCTKRFDDTVGITPAVFLYPERGEK